MWAKDKRTATENFRCRCFIVLEKNQKNLMGRGGVATIPPCHPRVKQSQVTILNLGPKIQSVKFPSIIRLKFHQFC